MMTDKLFVVSYAAIAVATIGFGLGERLGPATLEPAATASFATLQTGALAATHAEPDVAKSEAAFDQTDDTSTNRSVSVEASSQSESFAAAPPFEVAQAMQSAASDPSSCTLPPASEEAFVIALGGYDGGTLASVSVAGQDEETQFVTVEIAEGSQPLYIVAHSFRPMIWKLTGETSRVEHFIAAPTLEGAGVIGLSADRVKVLPPKACGGYHTGPDKPERAVDPIGLVSAALGRSVDGYAGDYELGGVMLPSGRTVEPSMVEPAEQTIAALTFDGDPTDAKPVPPSLVRSLSRFSSGGVAVVDPTDVVSPYAVEPYEVLPQQAGLIQLVQAGKIRLVGDGTSREAFEVLEPFVRFPNGLAGAHSVTVIFPDDIPLPTGDAGHSDILRVGEVERAKAERNTQLNTLPPTLE